MPPVYATPLVHAAIPAQLPPVGVDVVGVLAVVVTVVVMGFEVTVVVVGFTVVVLVVGGGVVVPPHALTVVELEICAQNVSVATY